MVGKLKVTLLLVMAVTLCGCSLRGNSTVQDPPGAGSIADPLQITFVNGPSIQASENLTFRVENATDTCLVFPYDFGIKIWVDDNGEWVEIDNRVQYSPEEDIILEPAGSLFSVASVMLRPDLYGIRLDPETDFTATIVARLCDDDTVFIGKQIQFSVRP